MCHDVVSGVPGEPARTQKGGTHVGAALRRECPGPAGSTDLEIRMSRSQRQDVPISAEGRDWAGSGGSARCQLRTFSTSDLNEAFGREPANWWKTSPSRMTAKVGMERMP